VDTQKYFHHFSSLGNFRELQEDDQKEKVCSGCWQNYENALFESFLMLKNSGQIFPSRQIYLIFSTSLVVEKSASDLQRWRNWENQCLQHSENEYHRRYMCCFSFLIEEKEKILSLKWAENRVF